MSNINEIILRIRKALLKKRMTQRDLAAALGKNEAEISRWMSGRMGISEPNLSVSRMCWKLLSPKRVLLARRAPICVWV